MNQYKIKLYPVKKVPSSFPEDYPKTEDWTGMNILAE